jgi:hypothetical protein
LLPWDCAVEHAHAPDQKSFLLLFYKKEALPFRPTARCIDMRARQDKTSFCEQKEAKKLCSFGTVLLNTPMPQIKKVFCFFFTKKKSLPF